MEKKRNKTGEEQEEKRQRAFDREIEEAHGQA
jgi:hypothetical protein